MKQKIYLDNNATTGLDPQVKQAMIEALSEIPANPSSVHFFGREAKKKLIFARQQIAEFLQVKTAEIIFTSNGTESMNMLIKGFCELSSKGQIISSNIEHSCVHKILLQLQKKGWDVSFLPAGLFGAIRYEDIERAISSTTKVIVLSAVNSETGVKIDLPAISRLAEEHKIPLIIDGVALLGKELFSIPQGVSAMGFSAHKIHGPKGVGFAFIRSGFKLESLLTGGDQEFSRRAGTENLPGIIGLAKAIDLLKTELPAAQEKMRILRDRLEAELIEKLNPVMINGQGLRVANTTNLSFPGVDGETLLMQLDLAGICVSHGSACSSGALEPSRILTSMGLDKKFAKSAIRFSLSRWTKEEEIDQCINVISEIISKLRSLHNPI